MEHHPITWHSLIPGINQLPAHTFHALLAMILILVFAYRATSQLEAARAKGTHLVPDQGLTARNTVGVSPGRLDRSPCGTGTSARLAVMHARRQIRKGQRFDHESIIGTHFLSEVVATTRVGGRPAVVTTVAGRAWITSIAQYGYDPDDPFPEGYTLSDTWLQTL